MSQVENYNKKIVQKFEKSISSLDYDYRVTKRIIECLNMDKDIDIDEDIDIYKYIDMHKDINTIKKNLEELLFNKIIQFNYKLIPDDKIGDFKIIIKNGGKDEDFILFRFILNPDMPIDTIRELYSHYLKDEEKTYIRQINEFADELKENLKNHSKGLSYSLEMLELELADRDIDYWDLDSLKEEDIDTLIPMFIQRYKEELQEPEKIDEFFEYKLEYEHSFQ